MKTFNLKQLKEFIDAEYNKVSESEAEKIEIFVFDNTKYPFTKSVVDVSMNEQNEIFIFPITND